MATPGERNHRATGTGPRPAHAPKKHGGHAPGRPYDRNPHTPESQVRLSGSARTPLERTVNAPSGYLPELPASRAIDLQPWCTSSIRPTDLRGSE